MIATIFSSANYAVTELHLSLLGGYLKLFNACIIPYEDSLRFYAILYFLSKIHDLLNFFVAEVLCISPDYSNTGIISPEVQCSILLFARFQRYLFLVQTVTDTFVCDADFSYYESVEFKLQFERTVVNTIYYLKVTSVIIVILSAFFWEHALLIFRIMLIIHIEVSAFYKIVNTKPRKSIKEIIDILKNWK